MSKNYPDRLIARRKLRSIDVLSAPPETPSLVAAAVYAGPENHKDIKQTTASQWSPKTEGAVQETVWIGKESDQANRVEKELETLFLDERPDLYPNVFITFEPNKAAITQWRMSHRSGDQMLRFTDFFEQVGEPPNPTPNENITDDMTFYLEHFPLDGIYGFMDISRGMRRRHGRILSGIMIGFGYATDKHKHEELTGKQLRGTSKVDALLTGSAKTTYNKKTNSYEFDFDKKPTGDKEGDKDNLSAAGLGPIGMSVKPTHIYSVQYVEQRVSFDLKEIERFRFRLPNIKDQNQKENLNEVGREVFRSLGLLAFHYMVNIRGQIRSGTNIVDCEPMILEEVKDTGEIVPFKLPNKEELLERYEQAVKAARQIGFKMNSVEAKPNEKLLELYAKRGIHIYTKNKEEN